jgi:hypothetical protein
MVDVRAMHSARSDNASSSAASQRDGAEDLRRARRNWRRVLVVYFVAMTTATHWPRLGFGGGGSIDKFIHFLGFGLLAWIAMHAAPWGRASIGFVAALLWVYLDEKTQSLPALGRTFSGADMVAGLLGVCAMGVLFAVRDATSLTRGAARDEARAIEAWCYARGANWSRAALVGFAGLTVFLGGMLARELAASGRLGMGPFLYALGFSGLFAIILATAVGLRLARFAWSREAGRRARIVRIPGWSWLLAIATTAALVAGYGAAVDAYFGPRASMEPSTDHEGFVILTQAFTVVAALVSICLADAIAVRGDAARAGAIGD